MINLDDYVNEKETEHNRNWPYSPDKPYKILIKGSSGSGKANVLLNSIEKQLDIDKIYLYANNLYEAKYQYLINKRGGIGIDYHNDPKAYIEYSNYMFDTYKNFGDYNPDPKNKILEVFDDMIADMINNKKLSNCLLEQGN